MSSTRLPGKVLLPFRGSTVLEFLYDKCREIDDIADVIVVTSILASDDAIEQVCNRRNILIFRGSLSDVLARFQRAAKTYCRPDDVVIRLCADSPLIDRALLQQFVDDITPHDLFFSTRYLDETGFISTTGKGHNIDAIKVAELQKLSSDNELAREHIVYGFDFQHKFRLYVGDRKQNTNDCIDTIADYRRLC